MKRVLLSIAFGFLITFGYIGVGFTVFLSGIFPRSVSQLTAIPLSLPESLLGHLVGQADVRHFELTHPFLAIGFELVGNAIIYSVLVYLIWTVIKRSKREPLTETAEPPPPPDFN